MAVFLLHEGVRRSDHSLQVDALRAKFPELRELTSLDEVVKPDANLKADDPTIIAIVLPHDDRDYFDRIAAHVSRQERGIFLVLIGDEISASEYKRLIQTGGADWVSTKADPSEMLDIIARRQLAHFEPISPDSRLGGKRPITISFVPSAGGVGNSTLLIESAAHLKTAKATRQSRICIVDLDFQRSHVCDYLDSEPRLQIADLSSSPDRLDEQLFESFKTRHSSGIDVFAAPRSRFSSESLDINALDALLSMIAARYDLVLIDYPVQWFGWTPQIIAACDRTIITGINTIPCLRQLCETLALVRSSGSAALKVAIAINRCERTLLGTIAGRKHVEMVLRNERIFFIGNRPEAVESVNMGAPMLLGPSARKCRREFAQMAEFCAGLLETRAAR